MKAQNLYIKDHKFLWKQVSKNKNKIKVGCSRDIEQ